MDAVALGSFRPRLGKLHRVRRGCILVTNVALLAAAGAMEAGKARVEAPDPHDLTSLTVWRPERSAQRAWHVVRPKPAAGEPIYGCKIDGDALVHDRCDILPIDAQILHRCSPLKRERLWWFLSIYGQRQEEF